MPTGSVLKETIAVSDTKWISVQNRHSRIFLRVLSCGRMREMRREPEVPEARVPVVECLGGPARIDLKGTCTNSFCEKWHPPECLFCKTKSGCRFGEKCSYAHRQVVNNQVKGPKSMMTKVPWLCWKVHDNWVSYVRTWSRRSLHRFCGRAQTYGNKSDVFNSQQPSYVMLTFKTKIHRLEWFAQVDPHQRNLNARKFEDRSQEETEWQERCAREAAWKAGSKHPKIKGGKQSSILLTFGKLVPACAINSQSRGKRICCRLWSVDAYGQQKGLEFCWNGYFDDVEKPNDKCITVNGEVQTHEEATVHVKELDIFMTMKVLEDTPAVLSLGKRCDEHGYSYEWINGQKPHLIKNGIRIQCNTENFVPIVVPGLSTSSSSSLSSSTSLTPSRQEIDHPTSSSSSSTSPTTTVSSDSETREREDLCRIDSYPVFVLTEHVERKERGDSLTKPTKNPKTNKNEDHDLERGDLLNSDIPEWLQEFRENLVDDRVPERKDSHASSSHELSLEPMPARSVDLGKHSVYTHFPERPKLRDLPEDQNYKSPVQKTHWRSRTSCRKFWWFDYSRSQSSQWRLWISKQSSICSRCARLGHPMDPVVSVQDNNFSGNTKELAKVLGAE